MTQPESRLRTAIAAALHAKGARTIKYHGSIYGESGVADLLACYQGYFVAIEVKRPGEHPTAIQARFLDSIREAGGRAGVATTIPEALKIMLDT
jgi:Holliday junction resolvase